MLSQKIKYVLKALLYLAQQRKATEKVRIRGAKIDASIVANKSNLQRNSFLY
jgi:DNA-binding IscR family transcriptional regulator